MPELLTDKHVTVNRHHTTPLLVNDGAASHFVTQYSPELLHPLLHELKNGAMNSINRLNLLNDATLLARAGRISSAGLIPLLDAYKNETSEPVWGIISLALAELRKFVETDKKAERALRDLSAKIAQTQYQALGWKKAAGETAETEKLRGIIVSMMLYGEDDGALATARSLFEQHSLETLDPELRSVILSSVVRHDSTGDISRQLITTYKETQNAELAQDICLGLTSTRSTAVIKELLDHLRDASFVRPQDVARWFAYLIRNRDARQLTWEWLTENWAWVEETFGGDKSYDSFPQYAASGLTTREQLEAYRTFFTPLKDNPALSRVILLGVSEIESRVALIETDGPAVRDALLEI